MGRRGTIGAIAGVILGLAVGLAAAGTKEVVIVTSFPKELFENYKKAFEAKHPGVAVVINVGSRDATILRTEASGTRTSTVPVSRGANALTLSPDGRHAIAWLNSAARSGAAPASPAGSFQDVTVITLHDGGDAAVDLTVGFRPRGVVFAADGSAGFVITEDGVSIVRFA